jgi:hypothetical protein
MIAQQEFNHQNIQYIFRWEKDHHKKFDFPKQMDAKITQYYSKIMEKDIPDELFETPTITRVSSFKLKNLTRGAIPTIRDKFIQQELVKVVKRKNVSQTNTLIERISEYVDNVYSVYSKNGYTQKPSHDTVIHNLLIKNEAALSQETPIWNPFDYHRPKSSQQRLGSLPVTVNVQHLIKRPLIAGDFTGHIDLILYDKKTQQLIISDYKPEGEFIRSLPQVAFYGLYIKKLFQLPEVHCVSFNKDELWIYNPEILRNELPEHIATYTSEEFEWMKFVSQF